MAFGDVLKALRLRRGFTQEDVAKGTQLSKSVISMYETGSRKPSFEVLEAIADFFNVDMNTLTDTKPMDAQPSANTDLSAIPNIEPYNPTMVPIVGTIAAGTPILAEENIEGYAPLQDRAADFALTVKGDSMIGDNIHPGDIVFIRQQPTVEIGEIAAVLIDGDATLKHFYRDGDSVTLVSSNPKYKPMVYHKGDCDDIRILGKAVAYLHDLE